MSSSLKEEAVALKEKGNEAFKQHDWPTAIEFYTKAIESYDQEPSFYTNRAQVCVDLILQPGMDAKELSQANIKLEAYGFAIADATKAIELDPANVKVR